MSGQQHALAPLYPLERPGTHFTGDWVGYVACSMHIVQKKGIQNLLKKPEQEKQLGKLVMIW